MNIVFFDVETQRTFDEVGSRDNAHKLGLAVAVSYSTRDGQFRHYTEGTVFDLIAELKAADQVVGFNVLSFDYKVLQAYTEEALHQFPTVDLLDHIYRQLGFRVSLDNLATATLGIGKLADGLQAVRWYKEGRIQDVIDYCRQDVEVTRRLYEYGKQNKQVKYRDRNYRLRPVSVRW
ncbi:MAG: ribonuclease H-like domain-containing protein [Anaerolineae bacterium]